MGFRKNPNYRWFPKKSNYFLKITNITNIISACNSLNFYFFPPFFSKHNFCVCVDQNMGPNFFVFTFFGKIFCKRKVNLFINSYSFLSMSFLLGMLLHIYCIYFIFWNVNSIFLVLPYQVVST